VTFLDAATWLAQIVMFVMLGLLVSPQRLVVSIIPAVIVALVLMLVARPVAVFCARAVSLQLARKTFIAWTGLRGAVAIFLASIRCWSGVEGVSLFDVAFVVVIISLLLQGWTLAAAARRLHVALPRADRGPRRGSWTCPASSSSSWSAIPCVRKPVFPARADPVLSKPTLVIRDQRILSPVEADPVRPATTSICWRRRKRPKRWIASSSTCSRARRLIRICSATSWSPANTPSANWRRSTASPPARNSPR